VQALISNPPPLSRLNLTIKGNGVVSLATIASLNTLEELCLKLVVRGENISVTSADVRALGRLQKLRRLHLEGGASLTTTDDDVIHVVQQLPSLRHLSLLMRLALSHRVIAALGDACPLLSKLKLSGVHDLRQALEDAPRLPLFPQLTLLHLDSLDAAGLTNQA
jgi:hypothetical protein